MEQILLAALLTGLIEVIKRTGTVSEKYLPLAAIVIGVVLAIVGNGMNVESVIIGLTVGLISQGLFDSTKSSITATKEIIRTK